MVYLGMGAGACKISRSLDAGFILFQFWVGPISVVPVCGYIILISKVLNEGLFCPIVTFAMRSGYLCCQRLILSTRDVNFILLNEGMVFNFPMVQDQR